RAKRVMLIYISKVARDSDRSSPVFSLLRSSLVRSSPRSEPQGWPEKPSQMRRLFSSAGWTLRLGGPRAGLATLLPSPSASGADALQPQNAHRLRPFLLRGFSSSTLSPPS